MIKPTSIFLKDIKLLKNHLVGAMLIQAMIAWLIPYLYYQIEVSLYDKLPALVLDEWFPKLQIAVSVIVAMIAAIYLLSEERTDKTIDFLKRLPINQSLIWLEKLLAGFVIIALTIVMQYVWFVVAGRMGYQIWDQYENVLLHLICISLLAYAVGIFLSVYIEKSINIILVGIILTGYIYWILITFAFAFIVTSNVFLITIIFQTLMYLLVPIFSTIGLFVLSIRLYRRTIPQINSLVRKQLLELNLLYILSFEIFVVLILFFIMLNPDITWSINTTKPISWDSKTTSWLALGIMLSMWFTVLLGGSTYQPQEKQSTRCILYYQPISRTRVFLVKFLTTFVPAFILCIPVALILTKIGYHSIYKFDSTINNNWYALSIIFCNWLCIVLLPYLISVLFTESIGNHFLNILLSIFASFIMFLIIANEYNMVLFVHGVYSQDYTFKLPELLLSNTPNLQWSLIVLVVSMTIAGWVASTELSILSGKTHYRIMYCICLFLIATALFYLINILV